MGLLKWIEEAIFNGEYDDEEDFCNQNGCSYEDIYDDFDELGDNSGWWFQNHGSVFCFLKIDVGENFPKHRREGILRSTSTLPWRCLLVVQIKKFSSVRMDLSSLLRKPQ